MTATEVKFNGEIHKAADLFPEMSAEEFAQFVEDINKHGLRDPIVLLPDGTLLDGRHRLRACQELRVEPEFVVVETDNPTAFVFSKNKHRRHLSSAQRAAIAAEAMSEFKAEAVRRMRDGGDRGGRSTAAKHGKGPTEKVREAPTKAGEAIEVAAKAFDTNAKYVESAVRIKTNDPETFGRLKSGELSMPEAVVKCAERTGKRDQIIANAAMQRASEFVGRISGVRGYCEKVSVDAIRSDERLRRHWVESCKDAVSALRGLLNRLEK